MNFNLASPHMLWLLALVAAPLVLFLWWAWRKKQELITQFISARLLGTLKVGVSASRQKFRLALLVAAVVCLILALARPQWGYTWEEARQRGLDILIAIDTSNSMLAEDTPPNRLTRAKLAALDLMRRAKTDRLGLIAFAGNAFLTCPLTLDDGAFGQSVEALDTHSISQGGTAIAEAIETARQAFKDEGENHKVLVLFTDGEDHDSEALKAAEHAAKEGMRIYTVGIGTPEGELLRLRDERGRVVEIKDENGNPVKSHLNEDLLKEIAAAAGGFYQPLRGTRTMDTLYDHPQGLGSLPKSTTSTKLTRQYHERYHWLVALAVVLLLLEMFLPDRQPRRAKSPAGSAGRDGAAAKVGEATALLLLLLLPLSTLGSPAKALREYEAGNYQDALKDYHDLAEQKKDDPRLHFNAGTAAYQSRQLQEATNQFNQSLNAPDLQLQQRAYYNLGNTFYRLGEQSSAEPAPAPGSKPGESPQSSPKMQAWEQALKHFDSALKLNPKDEDAKFNHAFVQKQIEELKKQQQQQQNKDGSKDDSKNQKQRNQKDQSQKDQGKQDQSQQDKDQQNSQDKPQPQQQQKPDQKKDQNQQAQKPGDQSDKQDQAAQKPSGQPKDQDQAKKDAEREAAMMAAGQMTPQQAQQLLDSQKDDDQVLQLAPPDNKNANPGRNFKNW